MITNLAGKQITDIQQLEDSWHTPIITPVDDIGLTIPKEGAILSAVHEMWTSGDLIDIGCDWGKLCLFCSFIHPDQGKIVGVDISQKRIDSAKVFTSKWADNITYYNESLPHLPFAYKSFNVALVIDVLEHIPDWKEAIREVKRIAYKGIFLVPRNNSWFWSSDHLWAFFDDEGKFPKTFKGHRSYDELVANNQAIQLSELIREIGGNVSHTVANHSDGTWWLIKADWTEQFDKEKCNDTH